MNLFKSFGKGGGVKSNGVRILAKTLVAATCALSIAFVGCSQKSGKATKVVVPTNPDVDIKKVATKLDSLIKANTGTGKGVVTGFLTGEGKTIAQGLLKQATNAGGERRLLQKKEIPLTGATILIFDALKPTTSADTTLKTDSAGTYTCVLKEGKYFGFAVYLDLETFQLVTTSIPNMNPKADTIVKMDTATAIEDVTAPTVAGVYDANTANSDGIFLVGSVPDKNAKINITFSESMNRESAKGVILGRIDTSNTSTSMVLADTVKGATVSWSGDSKELTISAASLTLGAQYGLIIPTSLKDLAKNPLEKEYKATFVTVAAAKLAAIKFAVTASSPADKESIKPIQNPGISFNRPVEVFSVLKGATIDPAIKVYWEISGARAVFIHKEPLMVGTTYTVTLPQTVSDLNGAGLEAGYTFTFSVKDFDGAAKSNTGREQEVALAVETAFDAYLSGDVGRFGSAFHQNFRLYDEDGKIKSKTEFLDMIRSDVGDRQAMAAGFPGPVFDNSDAACKDHQNRWKVDAENGTADEQIWVDAYVNPGQSPRAYDKDKKEIAATSLTWDPTGPRFTYKGKKYAFGPDMSKFKGPVNMDAAKNDMRFMGDMLKQTSTVVLEPVKREGREEFKVDPAVTLSGDTARLAVKMISYEKFNRLNFDAGDRGCHGALVDTNFQVLKFTLVNDGSKWLVISILSPSKETNRADFDKAVDTKNFRIKQLLPITLVSPLKDNAQGTDGKVTFTFKGPVSDSIGGYLVGIAEDPKFCFGRPPYGALIFVKASNHSGAEETLVLNSAGGPEGTNAAAILRRVQDFRLPGWERTIYDNALTTLFDSQKGFGGVYNWKVIAIKDTSAVSFLANGFSPDRFYAESDFGATRGYFACKAFPQGAAFATLETNQQLFVNTNPPVMGNSFSDMDMDGVPDGMEIKYKTDPKDRNSYPNFRVDTDGDGLADFLEAMLDPKGTDSLITRKADAAGVKAEIAKLVTLGIVWVDTDGDGFPDDIEMMSGFNPNDPKSNPGTTVRASAPSGVFAGKFLMGPNLNTISFKLYSDSSKALMVKYTAIIGKDTLIDSVKTAFNEMAGEVYIPVVLLKNGPDAGKALLMRGHYDANTSLLMGPIDMITAPAKGAVNFGGGPYVGQFAASGRGEDVTRYLPTGAPTNGGPMMTNPANPVNTGMLTYRLPPAGTNEGAKVILSGNTVTLINDFGDTVAVVANLNFRSQPDGSFEFAGHNTVAGAGGSKKMTDVGGRIVYDGTGNWIVDGHIYQEFDSTGVHKSIPGQLCAKAAKVDMTPAGQSISGTLKGWIAQDKTGNGFVGPVVTQPACDPARGPCNTNPVCDPAKGPCNTNPMCDPAKGPCNPNPVTSFNRSFMSGAAKFKAYVQGSGVKDGDYFFVSMNNRVYRVKNDSLHVMEAKAPLCGQVVLVPEAIPAKDVTDANKAFFASDSMSLNIGTANLILLMEDQFTPGMPNRLDKARDSQGDVRANVFVVEGRPIDPAYGKTGANCPANNNPMGACDPAKGACPQPACDPAKGACPQPACDPAKGACPQPACDPAKGACPQPACDPAKGACPQPACDPAKGSCGPAVGGFKPPAYVGPLDALKAALLASSNLVGAIKDSTMTIGFRVTINPGSIVFDTITKMTTIMDVPGASKYLVLSEPADATKLLIREAMPLVMLRPAGTPVTNPPVTNPPVTNPPVVVDTTKPAPYKGTMTLLNQVLTGKAFHVKVATANGLIEATVSDASVKTDGTIFTAVDVAKPTRIFVFIGDKVDPAKPALSPDGFPIVGEKPSTPVL